MRIFLIILCVITALTLLTAFILSMWVKLRVVYETGNELRVWAQILFFRYQILPVKQPKLKLRDFKIKRFRKLERKRALKAEKERLQNLKKRVEAAEPEPKAVTKLPLSEKLALLTRLIIKILRRFARYLHVDVSKLYIKVATDDAAGTAYLYSAAVQSAAYIAELLQGITNFDVAQNAEFSVVPDFSSAESELFADFCFRIRVLNLAKLGLAAFFGYTRVKKAQDNA